MENILKNKYIAIAISLLISACGNKTSENTTDVKQSAKQVVEVSLSPEQQKAIDLQTGFITQRNLKTSLKVNGKLMLPPQNQAQVSLLVGGIVKDILVKEGALITKGQVLATIQNTEFIQLQQDYLQSSSSLTYLKAEFERQKELQKENINSGKTFQKAEADYKFETSNYNALKQKLSLYNLNAQNLTPENISSSFNVIAPISGNIHTISINIGKFAEPNKELFNIVDNQYLHIDLTIFEKDISKIHEGQTLTFTDANDTKHIHNATIFSINKAFEDNQQAVIAHAKIENVTETLLSGMFIEARIQIDDSTSATVPNDAIVNNGNEHFIFILKEAHIYKMVQVTIGTSDMGFTEITPMEEIKPEQKIVTNGAYYLLSELTKSSDEHE